MTAGLCRAEEVTSAVGIAAAVVLLSSRCNPGLRHDGCGGDGGDGGGGGGGSNSSSSSSSRSRSRSSGR